MALIVKVSLRSIDPTLRVIFLSWKAERILINQILRVFFRLLGAELHCGHGGKDTEVSECTQTMPGVRSRGAQLLEASFQRAGGPTQRRLCLRPLFQDAQPTLCRDGWVLLFSVMMVCRRNQQCCRHFCDCRLLSTRGDFFMHHGMIPNQSKSVSRYTVHPNLPKLHKKLIHPDSVLFIFVPSFEILVP